MSVVSYKVLFFGVLAVSLGSIRAVTEDEKDLIRKTVLPIVAECSKEFGVNGGDIDEAKKTGNHTNLDSCFLGCVLKKAGIINNQGIFDINATAEKAKQFIKSQEDFKKFEDIGNNCSSVNEKSVSDGDKGCERAKLLLSCFVENNGDLKLFAP